MLVAVEMLVQLPFRFVVPPADDTRCQILIGLFCVVVVILRRCISDTSNLQLNSFDSNPRLWFALHVLVAHEEVRCAPVGLLVMTNCLQMFPKLGLRRNDWRQMRHVGAVCTVAGNIFSPIAARSFFTCAAVGRPSRSDPNIELMRLSSSNE